jgi:hypothetical protein
MTKSDSYISVWFDDTDSDNAAWVVDRCYDDETTETIKLFDHEENARDFAADYAESHGLEVAE